MSQYQRRGKLTLGQKSSDMLAEWVGSWAFIILFLIMIFVWISVNLSVYFFKWDPYPFILLNLVLSCVAAIQAPIILMSQNRAAQRDRIRAEYDYRIDRKAEREIFIVQNNQMRIMKMLEEIRKKQSRR